MSKRLYDKQEFNYDVSGGDENFDSFPHQGEGIGLIAQIFYTNLSQNDNKIVLQDSLDGINFHDAKDSAGNTIEVTLLKAATSAMLRVIGFTGKYVRLIFLEGTIGTGDVDGAEIMMQ